MQPLTQEWIEKAEGDFATASREVRARLLPNYDAVCFHAQQCERLVIDWRKKQQARAGVQVAIHDGLNDLPDTYDTQRFQHTLNVVYQHIYENYASAEQSTYARAA